MPAFHELPHEQRMAYHQAITQAGGEVASYRGECVQVALPRPATPFFIAMDAAGLEFVPGSEWFFPLGSDAPAEHLRHDGRYPGSLGFWLYAMFRPK